jgi:hypothetical protein
MEPYDAASLWKDTNTMLPPESTKKVQIKKIESIKGRKEF